MEETHSLHSDTEYPETYCLGETRALGSLSSS